MMHDEFEYPRLRVEAHPSIANYLASRTDEQLAALIYDETYRRNVFGTYPGLSGDHSIAIIAEARRRERERCAKIAEDDKAPYHGKHHSSARETAIAIAKAIMAKNIASPAPSIPAGYRLVPEEPTGEWLSRARHWIDRYAAGIDDEPQLDRIYSELPSAPAQQQEGDGE